MEAECQIFLLLLVTLWTFAGSSEEPVVFSKSLIFFVMIITVTQL
jgi:hypothetical protein